MSYGLGRSFFVSTATTPFFLERSQGSGFSRKLESFVVRERDRVRRRMGPKEEIGGKEKSAMKRTLKGKTTVPDSVEPMG
jgi:hypothetical protein